MPSAIPILVVDHYDSFTFILVDQLEQLGAKCTVILHDEMQAEIASDWRGIVLSPGPCAPDPAGPSARVVRVASVPILGVCLGMQTIALAFGARLRRTAPVHGRVSAIYHDAALVFEGMRSPLLATRYHSLIVDEATLPDELCVNARSAGGLPMAVRHRTLPLIGVQFHPESIASQQGAQLLANWLETL